jgi:cysteine synthase A
MDETQAAKNFMHPKIANSITDLIGRTPLLRLNRVIGPECKATILAKLESMEPCNSVKDRLALSMIDEAEKRGDISPGKTTLVEVTSGNTGISMAMIAAARGYESIFVMPDTLSMERRIVMLSFGAKLVLTPGAKGVAAAIQKGKDIADELGEKAFLADQFRNPDNPKVHRETTGPELWYQTDGKIDALVSGVGTGGTLTGSTQYLKSMKPTFESIAVEPVESAVLSGGTPGPHKIQGIGAGLIPDNCDTTIIDQIFQVSSDDAIAMSRRLALEEGLLVGISAGASVHAAVAIGSRPEYEGKVICVIIPSFGERYLSTVLFNDMRLKAESLVAEDA